MMENETLSYLQTKGWEFKRQAGQFILKICPFCQDSNDHFYISSTSGKFHCFKCEEIGNLRSLKKKLGDLLKKKLQHLPQQKPLPKPSNTIDLKKIEDQHKALLGNEKALSYLQEQRGFSPSTIDLFRLGLERDWIAIPYFLAGECVLIKYRRWRGEGDRFRREAGFESALFVSPFQADTGEAIVTEGEFDAVSLTQFGFPNTVSVSLGASGFKTEWIDHFEPYQKIFIAFDNDEKGTQGAEKLAEHRGRDRCYRGKLPLKDANECLLAGYGKYEIARCLREAEEYKPKSLKAPGDYSDQLEKLWRRDRTETVSTGWNNLDRLLGGLRPGELTIVTGETGQGKSTWVCNLALNQMMMGDPVWIGSFEQKPSSLLAKLASMHFERSFYRMTESEFKQAMEFLVNLPVRFLDHWGSITLETLKESIFYCRRRYGAKLAIVDHLHAFIKYTGDSERQAIDQAVTEIKGWAMDLEIPIILVVHPKNIQGGNRGNPVIEATDLKGSSGIRQWSDNVISIWRDKKREAEGENVVVVKLVKARDDTAREGNCVLRFDQNSQRYFDDT
jgi:twinkle protein